MSNQRGLSGVRKKSRYLSLDQLNNGFVFARRTSTHRYTYFPSHSACGTTCEKEECSAYIVLESYLFMCTQLLTPFLSGTVTVHWRERGWKKNAQYKQLEARETRKRRRILSSGLARLLVDIWWGLHRSLPHTPVVPTTTGAVPILQKERIDTLSEDKKLSLQRGKKGRSSPSRSLLPFIRMSSHLKQTEDFLGFRHRESVMVLFFSCPY